MDYSKWDDNDLSQPVFNPYSPLNPSPSTPRPVSSTMPEVYHPPQSQYNRPQYPYPQPYASEKEALPTFSFPATSPTAHQQPHYAHQAPEVAFHDAPAVVEEHSYPIYAPGPAVKPTAPFYVGPGDLLVPSHEGGTTTAWDGEPDKDPRVAAMEKPPVPKKAPWWRRVPARWRWIGLVLIGVVIIGVAAGVVISLVNKSGSDSSSGPDSSSDDPSADSDKETSTTPATTSTSPPLSATSFLSQPSSTPGPGSVDVQCPGANNTAWWTAVTGPSMVGDTVTTNVTFVRQCNRTFPISGSDASANVVRNMTARNFEDCMGECAVWNAAYPASGWRSGPDQNECIGVSWGYAGKQGTADNYCWLVKGVDPKKPGGTSRVDWESALIVVKKTVESKATTDSKDSKDADSKDPEEE